ncbi:unnamed protein product [Mycena citricolor]|uniref:Uncharacterized protein n=1 Tax=Mycena citricolor TaxID=2018698 RepID=A0AAD2HQB9_9AGAR|nr:unnamed protein product [Mycena citricolor]CAK5280168.1 unnamed protein product [Mycena citricolor]
MGTGEGCHMEGHNCIPCWQIDHAQSMVPPIRFGENHIPHGIHMLRAMRSQDVRRGNVVTRTLLQLSTTMAVPAEFTILNITGKFSMNKTLTNGNDTDTILRLQGVGWFKRSVIAKSTITLYVKHYKDDAGVEHIDIDQGSGIPGTREERGLNWQEREVNDSLFGPVVGKSRRVQASEVTEPFLATQWTADTFEHGLVESYVYSDTPRSGTTWIAHQTWGMEEIDGVRRYARHVKFIGPQGEVIETKLVYDYLGGL